MTLSINSERPFCKIHLNDLVSDTNLDTFIYRSDLYTFVEKQSDTRGPQYKCYNITENSIEYLAKGCMVVPVEASLSYQQK